MSQINYVESCIAQIQDFIKINSIRGDQEALKPFGKGVDQALDHFVTLAQNLDFRTFKDPDGYYAFAEVGPSDAPIIGILAHVDTVGIGQEELWTKAAPFSGEIIDGKIIGRGSLDDKGPLVINMYALKSILDSGHEFKHRIRIIVGGAEETTWEGINKYKEEQEHPSYGYSPDANFPLIHGEKGHLQFRLKGPGSDEFKISTSNSINAVCDRVLYNGPQNPNLDEIVSSTDDEGNLVIMGKSAHAMECFKGDSAIIKLVQNVNLNHVILDLIKKYLLNIYGEDLVPGNNEEMRLNIGNLIINNKESIVEVDMRFPFGTNLNQVVEQIKDKLSSEGVELEIIKAQEELFYEKDNPLVKTLLDVYNKEMNANEEPLTTGGGTYARAFKNCVAFGMVFTSQGMIDNMHQPNECLEVKFIEPALRIYQSAIIALDNL